MTRVVAGLIERDGRLLICQRRGGGALGLQWEFPGGKLKASETPRQGLTRELREELGVTAQIGAEIYRTQHRYAGLGLTVRITFFSVPAISQRPQNRVFERMAWVRPNELPKYDFLPADRELVRWIARRQLSLVGEHRIRRDSSPRSE